MHRVTVLLFLACLYLAGCGAKNLNYQSPAHINITQPEEVIMQALREQARPPVAVEVTDKYFMTVSYQMVHKELIFLEVVPPTVPVTKYVYYNSVQSLYLYKDGKWYLVQINGVDGNLLYRLQILNRERAEQLIDAINMLRQANRKTGEHTMN